MKKILIFLVGVFLFFLNQNLLAEIISQSYGSFYSTDISTLTVNADYTTESDAINLKYINAISVHAYGIAQSTNALSNITVYLISSPDGTHWDTLPFTHFHFVISDTTTAVMQGALIDTVGIQQIKILKINNANASDEIYDFNCYWAAKE